jgi:hypothetical protein
MLDYPHPETGDFPQIFGHFLSVRSLHTPDHGC